MHFSFAGCFGCFAGVIRIDAMFRKAKRWGITTDEFNMDFLSTLSDSRLFENIKFDQHCLHHLLPQVHEVHTFLQSPWQTN